MWKIRKFKTRILEKVIPDHAPADYIPKITNDPFKMENPLTRVSLYFAQCAKKVVSDSPGLVDFATGLVIFVLILPDGQVLFLDEEGLLSILVIKKGFGASRNDLWASTC